MEGWLRCCEGRRASVRGTPAASHRTHACPHATHHPLTPTRRVARLEQRAVGAAARVRGQRVDAVAAGVELVSKVGEGVGVVLRLLRALFGEGQGGECVYKSAGAVRYFSPASARIGPRTAEAAPAAPPQPLLRRTVHSRSGSAPSSGSPFSSHLTVGGGGEERGGEGGQWVRRARWAGGNRASA
jgi:hypothetical protein